MGQEEHQLKPEARKGDTLAKYAALISLLVFLITTWVVVLSNDPKSLGWFTFHPPLQSLSLCFFTYGILTLQPSSQPQTKKAGLARHQVAMLLLGFPAIAVGTSAMIYNKYAHGAPHFTSWHGIFGLVATIWLVLQIVVGGGSVWYGGIVFGGGAKAKAAYKYHRLSGYILLPWLLITVHLAGAWSEWMVGHTAFATSLIAYTIAPAIVLISVYARMRSSKMRFA
ncbi:hypothetical protein PILCRDRAFT_284994 [Piloderma croceum F 1598]|uniref:Cytochrome b561 domain-containing protein n=1 Tax=Piloderma croceum (strain F 1598) TaxID=765440 RepID=A0A0C3FTK2_PILCF|nr:hypothetical protein PILCRDRAFT_284994 [Piloderma croceum F 1598]